MTSPRYTGHPTKPARPVIPAKAGIQSLSNKSVCYYMEPIDSPFPSNPGQ